MDEHERRAILSMNSDTAGVDAVVLCQQSLLDEAYVGAN
jgi:hypothetical protein